jgi:hypothetical protein
MGVVYEAEHEDIERRVALKILRIEASEDPHQAAQFREEARAASRIGSPNIVEIFDFGELPDGRLMFAMELLNGHGLDTELDRCPMDQGRLIGDPPPGLQGPGRRPRGRHHPPRRQARQHHPAQRHRRRPQHRRRQHRRPPTASRSSTSASPPCTPRPTPAPPAPRTTWPPSRSSASRLRRPPRHVLARLHRLRAAGRQAPVRRPDRRRDPAGPARAHPRPARPAVPRRRRPPRARGRDPALPREVARRSASADMHDLEAALCEAQIAAGLRTLWDDLPLPAVDAERREKLPATCPRSTARPVRAAAGCGPRSPAASTLVAAGVTAMLLLGRPGPPEPGAEAEVEALTIAARAAGRPRQLGDPAEGRPERHRLPQGHRPRGPRRPDRRPRPGARPELRDEFATALVNLGDIYWERTAASRSPATTTCRPSPSTRQPDRPRARRRHPGHPRRLPRPRRPGHLQRVRPARRGPPVRPRRAGRGPSATRSCSPSPTSPRTAPPARSASLDRLIEATSGKPRRHAPAKKDPETHPTARRRRPVRHRRPAARRRPPSTPRRPPASSETPSSPPSSSRTPRPPSPSGNESPPPRPCSTRPSRFDNRNAAALIGLSDLEFDRGKHQRAADYAEKATAAAPKNGSYHLRLGDAYFKLLRYTDARRAYQKAKDLGVAEANERLDKLKTKLGG